MISYDVIAYQLNITCLQFHDDYNSQTSPLLHATRTKGHSFKEAVLGKTLKLHLITIYVLPRHYKYMDFEY